MKMLMKAIFIFLPLALQLLQSCAQLAQNSPPSEGSDELGAAQSVPRKLQFEFCWQDSPHANQDARNRVREVLLEQYGKTPLILSGFEPCGTRSRNPNIYKIYEYDSAEWSPMVSGVGTKGTLHKTLNGIQWNMILNHTFKNWSEVCSSSESRAHNCITALALHEVGHLVGLRHEHVRADSTCKSLNEMLDEEVIPVGRYDPDSIMNHCQGGTFNYFNSSRRLSPGDTATMWTLYGSLYPHGWLAMVSEIRGTVLKRMPDATADHDRCYLLYRSRLQFSFVGVFNNHIKVKLQLSSLSNECKSKVDGDTAYIFPQHFRFWR